MRLILPQEVLDIAFTNTSDFDISLIKDAIIEQTQLRWILPVLGAELWDQLVIEGDALAYTAVNQVLVNKLVTPMAFFVKYEEVPDISINQTSAGLQTFNTEFSSSATDTHRGQIQDQALTHAQTLLKEVIRYVEHVDNLSDYPLYIDNNTDDNAPTKSIGGLIF